MNLHKPAQKATSREVALPTGAFESARTPTMPYPQKSERDWAGPSRMRLWVWELSS